ncbi:sodium- and chloride-dependent neutral and basic amino acid transporter B(0+) isoform X1 [Dendroctonus ponderosae]|uniref:Transporter n=1 Tax=Dendroctonus ponderosae TaxID=77166 RepID=A0AAR5PZG5_DENPD|nr:sodium- and chloride-dependent neutral and basic amino acid transporter B(0+) isoform X1 [Dendroctonus ponderosae]
MRETWDKKDEPRLSDGQPVAKKWNITDPVYKPKGLTHSPSLRAIRNYNDLPIDRNSGLDNAGYDADYQYEYYMNPNYNLPNGTETPKSAEYDYPTMSTRSIRTSCSGGSEIYSNGDQNEMGSSVKLVTAKVEMSCLSWCSHFSTIICTVSIAGGLGTLYRLPQSTMIRGGLPFLVAYALLTILIGLPLLFLELGVGQMAQEGFIKSWRAVPFFKGIGYVKLLAGCLLSLYYPLYMGLALMYLIWVLNGPVPFTECVSGVRITATGYSATNKPRQECIRNTFIQSPFQDPHYFGIYAALLLFIWLVVIVLSIRRTKSYIRSLSLLFLPTMACYIALATKSILLEAEMAVLHKLVENVDWTVLKSADVWYYATIQVFFSTSVGFGSFITNAGIMYNKVNPLWTALGYVVTNLIFGTGSVIITTILTQGLNTTTNSSTSSIDEVQLFTKIYDAMLRQNSADFNYWMIATYLLFVFAGFTSMATLSYTLLKAIYGHDGIRLKWWQTSVVFSFCGFVLSCLLLLRQDFDLVHLLDHYIVGNLILISVVIEVLAIIAFYGTTRIQSDFEFMLGHILSKIWLILWWFIPFLLIGVFVWGLATMPLEGSANDPVWLYAVGGGVVLTAFVFIFVMGLFVMRNQDGYTSSDRLKTSLEPSHNWGPKDPMLRYNWVQWNSKSRSGERDFTLKRRGTKEYTKTIRKKAKREAGELSVLGLQGAYIKNNNNGTGSGWGDVNHPIQTVASSEQDASMLDSLEVDVPPKHHHHHHHHPNQRNTFSGADAPKGETPFRSSFPVYASPKSGEIANDENSEGYGTFRNKGPYIIDGDIGHVCHRRYDNEHEAVTEL